MKGRKPLGFSIIIPVKEINDYILESVPITLRMDYADFEVLVLPNEMPSEALPSCLKDMRVRVIPTGCVGPAVKRDMGAERAIYDRLAFLDDDAYPREDWLRNADKAFAETGACAIGGPGVTPPDSTLAERASGLFFETLVGGGGMDYRYRPTGRSFPVDDFPTVNLIVDKRAFFSVGGFDNTYWPGEDTKFCLDFVTAGHDIWYSPDVVVYHHRRRVLWPHLRQVGNYGKHRGYFAKRFPATSARLTYFVPSLFLIGVVGFGAAACVNAMCRLVFGSLMLLYFGLVSLDVFGRTPELRLGLLTVLTVFMSHLTYGAMFLRGLLGPSILQSRLR
jgi:glycosyltransferase involved in cell wall biosynthesis